MEGGTGVHAKCLSCVSRLVRFCARSADWFDVVFADQRSGHLKEREMKCVLRCDVLEFS
jgi:hypothetical protein